MPAPIQSAGAVARLFAKFGIQGKHPLSLDNTVVPVAILEDVSQEAAPQAPVNAWAFVRCNATAAVGGAIQITNAGLDSAVDLIIDEMEFQTLAASQCGVKLTNLTDGALLLGVQSKVWRDTGTPGVPPGVPDHRDASAYAANTNLVNKTMVATVPFRFSPGWTLSPGFKIAVTCSTVNVRLQGWFKYRVISRVDR